ncbi:unnamed protein product [Clonostachys chloroleuca]|uniref:Ankyrin n=1 Tax=Clonostachys chloroleuca TaxID=1926264 RepID=A0AA35LWV8_9HYPO|nr:unnamed protein product [Clonostachys chloroleuca]
MMEQVDPEARNKVFSVLRNNEIDALKSLLAESPYLANVRSFSGTALAVAVCHGNPKAVQVLLDAGASPLGDETFGNTFLSTLELAAAYGSLETMRLLLVRLKATSPTGVVIWGCDELKLIQRAMSAAAASGHVAILVQFLDTFDCSDEAIEGSFLAAVGRWEVEAVELLLQRPRTSWRNKELFTKAFRQAMRPKYLRIDEERSGVLYHDTDWDKHYRLVTRLLDETDIDVRQPEHGHFLSQALDGLEMQGALRALLDTGIDPNTRFENGCTPLHLLASPKDMYEITKKDGEEMHELGIRVLREKGASITIENNEGETPSHWAAELAETATFTRYYLPADDRHLLSTNQYGETLLHFAAAGGKHKTVEFLVSCGKFDVNATNSTSWTPLLCALVPNDRACKTEIEAVKTARLLLTHGADPRAVTAEGLTVLHLIGSHWDLSEQGPEDSDEDNDYNDNGKRQKAWSTAFEGDSSAATLAKEFFLGHLGLPSVQSPATFPSISPLGSQYDVWGGRLYRLLHVLNEETPSSNDIHIVKNRSPLHFAAECGASGVAKVLKDLGGADNEAKDTDGKTPWDLAHERSLIFGRAWEATKKAVQ